MTINALNSGAKVWLADLEDATSPTWDNVINGQLNLRDAAGRPDRLHRRRTAGTTSSGRAAGRTPTIVVRPRGWHLPECTCGSTAGRCRGALFDFGLYLFHCARRSSSRAAGPYFYLPKIENHLEARLWNDIFVLAQDLLGIPRGTIRATVLIETITAAFEMEEILYELREHAAGLNAGRWDYMFCMIKNSAPRRGSAAGPRRR